MSSNNKKQGDSFGQQHDEWLRAYTLAPRLRERFPNVEQLVIELTFADTTGTGKYSGQMHSFGSAAKAFFAFACPRTLCLHGGFDLDAIVLLLFNKHRGNSTGILKCHGWLHPDHSNNAQCPVQMSYRLEALYQADEARDASARR